MAYIIKNQPIAKDDSIVKINGEKISGEVQHFICSRNGTTLIKIDCIASSKNYDYNLKTGFVFDVTLPYCMTVPAILWRVNSESLDNEAAKIQLTFTYQNETINKAI